MNLPLRADLVGKSPYGAPQLDVPVALNVNENPFAPSAALVTAMSQAVATAATKLNRYPDRDALALRADLVNFINSESGCALTANNIWPANGSNEVMLQIMQAFGGPGHRVLSFAPSYSMYPDYCRDTFTEFVTEPRGADFELGVSQLVAAIQKHQPHILLLGSPNNPTGTVLPPEVLQAALDVAPGLVVVDEAYAEFREPDQPSATLLVAQHPNLIVTRTMSKAFSCAGLRLGYAIASGEIVDALQLVRLPYHLSGITQEVARAALAHAPELLAQVALLRAERNELSNWLTEQGFTVAPSGGNFLLFGEFADRDLIWQRLLDQGVLIRQTGPAGWLRVSIGTPEENIRFKQALLSAV